MITSFNPWIDDDDDDDGDDGDDDKLDWNCYLLLIHWHIHPLLKCMNSLHSSEVNCYQMLSNEGVQHIGMWLFLDRIKYKGTLQLMAIKVLYKYIDMTKQIIVKAMTKL